MTDYAMLYESIVLAAWGKHLRREDPLKMGDADTLGLVDNELSGIYGHNAKFGLSAALKKVAVDNEGTEINEMLINLDNTLWAAKTYNELCQILEKAKVIFQSIGFVIV
jgi:hypothetical protein